MASSTLTIRVDDDLKREAAEVADYYGLDLSSVTRAFFKQMVNTHRIPLTFAPEEPNAESLEAIREGDAFLKSGKKGVLTMVPLLSLRRWRNDHADRRVLCCLFTRFKEKSKTPELESNRTSKAH